MSHLSRKVEKLHSTSKSGHSWVDAQIETRLSKHGVASACFEEYTNFLAPETYLDHQQATI